MKRLDRYLVREMVVPFLIGQGAVVLMLTGTVLYNNADTFLNYGIPAPGVAKIAVYFMPYLVHLTMPVAMAVAAALTVSRLSRDSEITAMRAAGVSLTRIFLPVFVCGLLLSLGDLYFGERVVPWSNQKYEQTLADLSRSIKFLVPQERQVVQSPDHRYTAYVGRMDFLPGRNRVRLTNVLILASSSIGTFSGASEEFPIVINAPFADYDDGVWTLHRANVRIYKNGGRDETYIRSEPVILNFRIEERAFSLITLNLPLYSANSAAATSTLGELAERIRQERRSGAPNPRDILDFHFKLSVPFSCLVFALAAPPLSLRFARAGSFMGVLLSIILVFVYWNTLLAAKIIGAKYPGILPPMVAAWGQNVLFSGIGLFVLWRSE